MLIWQGLGAYAFVIPFFLWLGILIAANAVLGADRARELQILAALSLLVSAALVYLLAKRLDARPVRVMIDKATGQEVTLQERHTMFFIPIRYWSVILAGFGVVLIARQILAL